jgi:hypothetical protein
MRDGRVGTSEEMCLSGLWYYTQLDAGYCISRVRVWNVTDG